MSNKEAGKQNTLWRWTCLKPSVEDFKIFGWLCYENVPEQLIVKLDYRKQIMILINYHSTCAYKIFSSNKTKVIISRLCAT